MPTAASTRFTNVGLRPAADPKQARVENVKLPASVTYAKGTILGELVGNDEVQILTPGGTISGGTWTITYAGQTTAAIAYNAAASAIQSALEALSNVGVGGIGVTGGPISSGVVTLTFRNQLGKTNVAQVTVGTGSLTGTSPTLTPSTTTAGSAGTPGTFKATVYTATDGSQVAKCVLQFDCATDASGNITYGAVAGGGEFGQTDLVCPAYFSGTFNTADLTGLTEQMMADLGARYVFGSIANGGQIRIP